MGHATDLNRYRYVEMLEQQQAWLVSGLQELYRRTNEGEGWPGEPLKPEPNGHPLTHDLLTRLGALDRTKGEHFEENTEVMQQDLWRQNMGYMQRQESSDSSSESAQSPLGSRFDAFNRHQAPLTPPSYSPVIRLPQSIVKHEPQLSLPNNGFANIPMHGVVDPVALQEPAQWTPPNSLGSFDNMEFMATDDYTALMFDEQSIAPGPIFRSQLPMNCMPTFLDPTEDFQQYLNPNTPISSI